MTALELFFDLVFVLALTQCTRADGAATRPGQGSPQGMLVLGGAVVVVGGLRLADERRRPRGGGRAARRCSARWPRCSSPRSACPRRSTATRPARSRSPTASSAVAHIVLFAARQPRRPRPAPVACSASPVSTAVGVGLLIARGARSTGVLQGALWVRRAGPRRRRAVLRSAPRAGSSYPGHFAERHGLIIIIALGESIVAIGVGAGSAIDAGVVVGGRARRSRSPRRCGGCTSTSSRSSPARRLAEAPTRRRRKRDRRATPTRYLHLPDGCRRSCSSRSASRRRSMHVGDALEHSRRRSPCSAARPSTSSAHIAFRLRNVGTAEPAAPRRRRGRSVALIPAAIAHAGARVRSRILDRRSSSR